MYKHIDNLVKALNDAGIKTKVETFTPYWEPKERKRKPAQLISITLFTCPETELVFDAATGRFYQ